MRKLILNRVLKTKNYKKFVALVDNEDFEKVNKYNWHIQKSAHILYAMAIVKNKVVYLHNFIMQRNSIDHIDGNGLNNQRNNLRKATHQQNQFNQKIRKGASSKYKGVSLFKRNKNGKTYAYWYARIRFNKKSLHLGSFNSEKKAGLAYNKKAKELFGEFVRLNKIK